MEVTYTSSTVTLLVVILINLFVGGYTLVRVKNKSSAELLFVSLALSIGGWSTFILLRQAIANETHFWKIFFTRGVFASSLMMNISVLTFSLSFPHQGEKRGATLLSMSKHIYRIGAIISLLVLFTPLFIIDYKTQSQGAVVVFTSLGNVLSLYYPIGALLTVAGFLVKRTKLKKKIEKKQVDYALIGFLLSSLGIFSLNFSLPLLGITTLSWLGPIFSLAMIGFIGAAVLRLNLWDTKLVLSEILLGGMGIIITIFLFLSSSWVELLLNLTTLFVFLVLASILLREVLASLTRTNKLRRVNKKLTETIEAKDNFLRMTSHQLRTPLTSLNGFLSMVVDKDNKEYSLDEKSYRDVIKVYINSQRLASVVNDILTVNAINAGRFGLNIRVEEDLEFIVQMILIERKSLIEYYGREVEYHKKGQTFKADVDPTRFREIIQNLIDNAVIYAQEHILVELIDMPHDIRIVISDDGIGFTSYEKRKMADRSYRGKAAVARHPNGSGMGLFIVEKIVKAHQGNFKIHSEGRGKGTVVIVELPKKQKE